jgi:transcriptional antiterminator RfaH
MPWIAARLMHQREALALDQLKRGGYPTYAPHMRERRIAHGRVVETTPLLFPSYIFVTIEAQWHAVRWTPGIASLVMHAGIPAHVPDRIIAEIKSRERNGLVELERFRPGDLIVVRRGLFEGRAGLYAGMSGTERVVVLLALLGAQRRVAVPVADVEAGR